MEVEEKVLVDDKPQVVNADLRKFNKSEEMVNKAMATLKVITAIPNKENCDAALITLKEAKTVETKIEAKRKDLVKPFNDAVKKINAHAKGLSDKLPVEIDRVKGLVLGYQKEEEKKALEKRSTTRIAQLFELGMEKGEPLGGVTPYRYQAITVDTYMIDHFDDQQWSRLIGQVQTDINNYKQQQLATKKQELADQELFGDADDAAELQEEIKQLEMPAATPSYSSSSPSTFNSVKGVTKRWTFEITDPSLVPAEFLVVDEVKVRQAIADGTRSIPGINIFQKEGLTLR